MMKKRFFTAIERSLPALCPEVEPLERIKESLWAITDRFSCGPNARRVFEDYHWPLYRYVRGRYVDFRSKDATNRPFIVGLSAPQGCGKTTVTNLLTEFFRIDDTLHSMTSTPALPVNCVALSLDDFYLRGEDQETLALASAHNPLLKYRGNAGTHDLSLIRETIEEINGFNERKLSDPDASISLPRYSKALREGRGDRLPRSQWTVVRDPIDAVLFEGWMLGFSPFEESSESSNEIAETLSKRTEELRSSSDSEVVDFAFQLVQNNADKCFGELNENLKGYDFLHSWMDEWIILALADSSASVVYQWRLQAEHQAKLVTGGVGLSDEEVKDFVARFMPAYQLYLPRFYMHGPLPRTKHTQVLKIIVNNDRFPAGFQLIQQNEGES